VYSKIHSRLDWFFDYIGEPEDDFVVELYGDVNFDGYLNVADIVTIVSYVLNTTIPTEEEFLTADMNQDGIVNILDVIQVVGEILGTTFRGSVEWLKVNYPELDVEQRLQDLDIDIHSSRSVYDVGDIVSEQHQNIEKSTCYEGNDYDVNDIWSLADWNGATNGGHYNVIFIEMSATW